jgi:RNA polymerase sigma factor (sigma-70 family)
MMNGQLTTLIRHLRKAVRPAPGAVLDDAELLERFVASRDEAAFELLLWRHGPMVLGVCRRVLHHTQDTEDAFQATFLTLVRKAPSVARRGSVGSWLYKVALRAALAARQRRAREAAHEPLDQDVPTADPPPDLLWRDLRPVLDEEVGRLPEKHRRAFVLCYLQGRTNAEAARELGIPEGTVASRLSWARQRLRSRLGRRGLTLSAAGLTLGLPAAAARAGVPAGLVALTLRAALALRAGKAAVPAGVSSSVIRLTEGVLQAMCATKLKMAVAVLLVVSMLSGGAGLLAYRVWGADRLVPAAGEREEAQAPQRAEQSTAPPAKGAPAEAEKDRAREEVAKQLQQARSQVVEMDARLHTLEKHWTDELIQVRGQQVASEENLRLIERQQAVERARERAEINTLERRVLDMKMGAGKDKDAAEFEKSSETLLSLDKRWKQNEEQRSARLTNARQDLVAAEERLRLLEREQSAERGRVQAQLEAAEERVRLLQGEAPASDAAGRRAAELERKVDLLLRELTELRKELRRPPDEGSRPERPE